jgi:hypothetical protein
MTFIEQLLQSFDARLAELGGEISALTQAREELVANGAAAAAPRSTTRPRRARRRARRSTTGSETEIAPAGKLHRLLAKSDGLSTVELSEQANADPAQVLPVLRHLETEGRVRRTGQRRGTRWHAVASHEEWIAQRAAELAARSRSS